MVGIHGIEALALDVDGDIFEQNGGFVIRVDRSSPKGRRRFTIAHEIGHALLFPVAGVPRGSSACGRSAELERLCDIAATEFIMPAAQVGQYFARREASIENIVGMARDFDVSFHAAALRMVELLPWCSGIAALVCDSDAGDPTISWTAGCSGDVLRGYGMLHLVQEAIETGSKQFSEMIIGAGGQARKCVVEAAPLAGPGRMLLLIRRGTINRSRP